MGSGIRPVKRECVPAAKLNIEKEAQDDVPNCFSSTGVDRCGRVSRK
jgi:hypothetical protein